MQTTSGGLGPRGLLSYEGKKCLYKQFACVWMSPSVHTCVRWLGTTYYFRNSQRINYVCESNKAHAWCKTSERTPKGNILRSGATVDHSSVSVRRQGAEIHGPARWEGGGGSAGSTRMIISSAMRWARHVSRMEENRNECSVLKGKHDGQKPLGRHA
jgi:hypothetical protein